jgi:hypothetical protein
MIGMTRCRDAALLLAVLVSSVPAGAQNTPSPADAEHRAIFSELVEINTSPAGGSVAPAA